MTSRVTRNIDEAVSALQSGFIISYPTEYGFFVGCDPNSMSATLRIFSRLKMTLDDDKLILITNNLNKLLDYTYDEQIFYENYSRNINGKKSFQMKASNNCLSAIKSFSGNINARICKMEEFTQLINKFGRPIASLNPESKNHSKNTLQNIIDIKYQPNSKSHQKNTQEPVNKQKKYFISYSSQHIEDLAFSHLLRAYMEKNKMIVWQDSKNLETGDLWKKEINFQIESCDMLILIISPASQASHFITYEWSCAYAQGVKIVPIEIRKTKLNHEILKDFQINKFYFKEMQDLPFQLENLVKKIEKLN